MIMIKKMNKLKCDSCHGLFPREELVFVQVVRPQSLQLKATLCHKCDDRMTRYLRFMDGFECVFDE